MVPTSPTTASTPGVWSVAVVPTRDGGDKVKLPTAHTLMSPHVVRLATCHMFCRARIPDTSTLRITFSHTRYTDPHHRSIFSVLYLCIMAPPSQTVLRGTTPVAPSTRHPVPKRSWIQWVGAAHMSSINIVQYARCSFNSGS